jgi:hypothetical protein
MSSLISYKSFQVRELARTPKIYQSKKDKMIYVNHLYNAMGRYDPTKNKKNKKKKPKK